MMCGPWTSKFDETADLRRIKLLHIVDGFTREALAVDAAHSVDSDHVVATVEVLVHQRGSPARFTIGAWAGEQARATPDTQPRTAWAGGLAIGP